jgi:hypothetical protein
MLCYNILLIILLNKIYITYKDQTMIKSLYLSTAIAAVSALALSTSSVSAGSKMKIALGGFLTSYVG